MQSIVAHLQTSVFCSSPLIYFTTYSVHASAVFLRQVQTLLLQSISLSFVLYTSLIIVEQPISVLFLASIAGSSLVE